MVLANKVSYHRRLLVFILTFSWTIILCFIGYQYLREKQYKYEFLSAQLQLYNKHLLETIDEGLSYEDYIASHEQPFDNLRITIIARTGSVIFDNILPLDSLDNHRNRPEIQDALKNGTGYHIGKESDIDEHEYFYSATCGERVIVRTALPYSSTLQELLEADCDFLGVMISISLFMSILAYFATRRLGNTIERLNRFAAKAEKGEVFDEEKPFPNDELGAISSHIVQLYAQWQQTIKDRDMAHKAKLKEEQEKIRIKRQLTNNINHELKTPVASIQVCLETLLSNINLSDDKKIDLIQRCYTNNIRLRKLLDDISLITRIEDGEQPIGKEKFAINGIIDEIKDELDMMPEDKRLCLHTDINDEIIINGNQSLISSIFRNLTKNAVAYSGGNNIYIKVLKYNDEYCSIRFEDDGKGVSEEELPRLFERFYRIDKGRSRQISGTGLGLAIVKHAVQFHNGIINVTNRPKGGLRYEFTLRIG